MSRLRIGFDFYSAHCYHLILIGEPIFSAFVLQREAAFRVCLAFLQLPPSSIAGIINSTLLPRCQASTLPQLIWSSSQREGWGFPAAAPLASLQAAAGAGPWDSGRINRAVRCHHRPSRRLPSRLPGAIPGVFGGPSECRVETPEDLLRNNLWFLPRGSPTFATDLSHLDSAASSGHTCCWHWSRGYRNLSAFGGLRHNL